MPLSWIITKYGWGAFFTALTAACGVALLLLAPLMRLPSYTERRQQQMVQSIVTGMNGNGNGNGEGNGVVATGMQHKLA